MSIEDEIHKGQQAKELLENPLMKEILENFRRELTKGWISSKDIDTDGRERIYIMMKTVEKFEAHLNAYIANGRFASDKLEVGRKKTQFQNPRV